MAKDNNGILSFIIDFNKLNLLSLKLKEKLGKSTKVKSIKDVGRCQFLKWIVSCYASLPQYIDKSDIGDSQLQSGDISTPDLWDHFSELLATFINCGLTLVIMPSREQFVKIAISSVLLMKMKVVYLT
jgi:hypothetical protein